jgi:hypothetical protein
MDKIKSDGVYENHIVCKMMDESLTMSQALFLDLIEMDIDPEDVYTATEYLEAMFDGDMNKVKYYMLVLTGQIPDCVLVPRIKTDDNDP